MSVYFSIPHALSSLYLRDPIQNRMAASVTLFCIVFALAGVHELKADSEHIDLDSFSVGECVEVTYTAPSSGRASINLYDAAGDIVLHVDYRVNWNGIVNTVIFNTRTAGAWGPEEKVTGVKSTPGTGVEIVICPQEANFMIKFNQMELATYDYRTTTEVSRVEYDNYSYDSTLKVMCAVYSA